MTKEEASKPTIGSLRLPQCLGDTKLELAHGCGVQFSSFLFGPFSGWLVTEVQT